MPAGQHLILLLYLYVIADRVLGMYFYVFFKWRLTSSAKTSENNAYLIRFVWSFFETIIFGYSLAHFRIY